MAGLGRRVPSTKPRIATDCGAVNKLFGLICHIFFAATDCAVPDDVSHVQAVACAIAVRPRVALDRLQEMVPDGATRPAAEPLRPLELPIRPLKKDAAGSPLASSSTRRVRLNAAPPQGGRSLETYVDLGRSQSISRANGLCTAKVVRLFRFREYRRSIAALPDPIVDATCPMRVDLRKADDAERQHVFNQQRKIEPIQRCCRPTTCVACSHVAEENSICDGDKVESQRSASRFAPVEADVKTAGRMREGADADAVDTRLRNRGDRLQCDTT